MSGRLIPLNGGSPIKLDKPILVIGRHPDCDIVVRSSTKVSRRHCCVAQVNERFLIRDLGSMNGVRVNGIRVLESDLKAGDEVSIGDVLFAMTIEAGPPRRAVVEPNELSVEFPVAVSEPSHDLLDDAPSDPEIPFKEDDSEVDAIGRR